MVDNKKTRKGVPKTKGKPKAKPQFEAKAPKKSADAGMVALATAVVPPETVIHAQAGDTLTLTAAVTNAVVPYAVS